MDFKLLKRNKIILGIISAICGIFLMIWPMESMSVICTFFGGALALYGIFSIFLFLLHRRRGEAGALSLLPAICTLIIGIWILLQPTGLIALIPTVIGIAVITDGFCNLFETTRLNRQSYRRWWLSLLLGLLTIGLGAVLILKPFGVASFLTIMIGIVLLYNGITDLWIASRIKISYIPSDETPR